LKIELGYLAIFLDFPDGLEMPVSSASCLLVFLLRDISNFDQAMYHIAGEKAVEDVK